jgi:hypothetical protein
VLGDLAVSLRHGRMLARTSEATGSKTGSKPDSAVDVVDTARTTWSGGARGGSRTPTPFRAPDPKSGASAIPPLSRWLKL